MVMFESLKDFLSSIQFSCEPARHWAQELTGAITGEKEIVIEHKTVNSLQESLPSVYTQTNTPLYFLSHTQHANSILGHIYCSLFDISILSVVLCMYLFILRWVHHTICSCWHLSNVTSFCESVPKHHREFVWAFSLCFYFNDNSL